MAFDPDEYLATQPANASVFATPSDLADYAKHGSLATGDNGEGAWGDDTTSGIPQVALPRDTITDADHGRPVHLMGDDGNVVTAYVTDKMPATAHIKNGATIDLNPAAQAAIGHPGGVAPVRWRFADADGGNATGAGASSVPGPADTYDVSNDGGALSRAMASVQPSAPFDPDAYLASAPALSGTSMGNPIDPRPPVTSTVMAAPDDRTNTAIPDSPPSLPLRAAGDAMAALSTAGGNIIAGIPRFAQDERAQYLESQVQPQSDQSPAALLRRRGEITDRLAEIADADAHSDGPPLPPSQEEQRLRAELATLTPEGQSTATTTAQSATDARGAASQLATAQNLVKSGYEGPLAPGAQPPMDTRIAEGIGDTISAVAPFGAGMVSIAAQASNSARDAAEAKAKADGLSADAVNATGDAAANAALENTAATLPAYMAAGSGASKLAGAITPETAGAIRRFLTETAAATGGNVVASAAVRAAEGQPIAPTAEGFLGGDLPFAITHAGGEAFRGEPDTNGNGATAATRQDAQAGRVDFTPDATSPASESAPRDGTSVASNTLASSDKTAPAGGADSEAASIPISPDTQSVPETIPTASPVDFTPDPPAGQADIASAPTPVEASARGDFGDTWDAARATLETDPTAGQRLVDDLNNHPRPVTDEENALLLQQHIAAQTEHDAAVQAVNTAPDAATRADALARLSRAQDALDAVQDANRNAGTDAAPGLAARQLLDDQRYDLDAMLARRQAANGGKPLTDAQRAEVGAAHDQITSFAPETPPPSTGGWEDAKRQADEAAAARADEEGVSSTDTPSDEPDWSVDEGPSTPPENRDRDLEAEYRAEQEQEAREGVKGAGGVELLDAVRAAGGLPTDDPVLRGELQGIRENSAPIGQANRAGTWNLFRRNAPTLDELTSRLQAQGFDVQTPADTLDLINQRVSSKKPVFGFAAHADADTGMAGSEAYFRRQQRVAQPPRTPEELRPIQQKWMRALKTLSPKTALRLEIVKQDALDSMWGNQRRPTATDGSSPHAAYLDGAIYLSEKALRGNTDQINRVNFLHEITHHFERVLPADERMRLEKQSRDEMASGSSPLHNDDGTPRADADPRAFDTGNRSNFSEWLAERVAWDNEQHFAGKIDTALNGTATARFAARVRDFVGRVWRTVRPGMSQDNINARFRDWLGNGAGVDNPGDGTRLAVRHETDEEGNRIPIQRGLPSGKKGRHPLLTPTNEITGAKRDLLRDNWVRRVVEQGAPVPEGKKPILWMMGGGSGSGKSTLRERLLEAGVIPRKGTAILDSDAFKEQFIPEYKTLVHHGDAAASTVAHAESADLLNRAFKRVLHNRANAVLDGTMSYQPHVERVLRQARAAGYDVRAVGVTVHPEVALERARVRAEEKGRAIPVRDTLDRVKGFANNFENLAPQFDRWQLYDNNTQGAPHRLIAERNAGLLDIHDQRLYDEWKRTPSYDYEGLKQRATAANRRGATAERGGAAQAGGTPSGLAPEASGAGSGQGPQDGLDTAENRAREGRPARGDAGPADDAGGKVPGPVDDVGPKAAVRQNPPGWGAVDTKPGALTTKAADLGDVSEAKEFLGKIYGASKQEVENDYGFVHPHEFINAAKQYGWLPAGDLDAVAKKAGMGWQTQKNGPLWSVLDAKGKKVGAGLSEMMAKQHVLDQHGWDVSQGGDGKWYAQDRDGKSYEAGASKDSALALAVSKALGDEAVKAQKQAQAQTLLKAGQAAPVERTRLGKKLPPGLSAPADPAVLPDAPRLAEARRQATYVTPQRDDRGRLVAPDGQPSMLVENQWRQVRTPDFKGFFGDWQNDPAKASKIVDSHGEPRIMYRSTKAGNSPSMRPNDRGQIYLSESPDFADGYGDRQWETFVNARRPWDYENAEDLAKLRQSITADPDFRYSYSLSGTDKGKPLYQERLAKLMAEKTHGESVSDAMFDVANGDWMAIDRYPVWDHLQKLMKQEGYDGVYITEGGARNLVVPDPRQVKSATHNAGTFDPDVSDTRFATRRTPGSGATVPVDTDQQHLMAEQQRAKDAFEMKLEQARLAARPLSRRAADAFVRWQRAFKLSSPVTLAKLASAAVTRSVTTPLEEAVGGAYSAILPRVAAAAPREGGVNLHAEARALTEGMTKGIRQIGTILRTGHSDHDVLFGDRVKVPHTAADFLGAIHGAIKAPVKEAEFARSLEKRTAHALANGVDVHDPLVQTRLMAQSYQDANRAIFMQKNFAAEGWNNLLRSLERNQTHPTAAFYTAKMLRFLLPIVKVPTNIVGETVSYAGGLPIGAAHLANVMRRGMGTLKPEEADLILRNLKKGSVGAALMTLGYLNPKNVGGYYQQGDKRDPKDVKFGGVRLYGVDVPRWLLHAPAFEALHLGATIRRVSDQYLSTGDKKGVAAGTMAGLLGLVNEIPFVNTAAHVTQMLSEGKEGDYQRGEMLKSTVVPMGVQDAAKWTDQHDAAGEPVKRQPQTLLQHVEMGVPGLRQDVPLATGTKQDRATNLPLMTPAQRTIYQQEQIDKKVQAAKMRRMRTALTN